MKIHALIIFLFLSVFVSAQTSYSYIHERLFDDPTDLIGYNFVPHKMEKPGDYDATNLDAGSYSFGITRQRLYVSGEDIEGVYEVNNISPTSYGYKLTLLNPRNPAHRGHLKVVTNKLYEAEVVVFKKENKSNEIIFHLPDASEEMLRAEKKYFTDRGEIEVESVDSLWGMKFQPYLRVVDGSGIQDRFYPADSTFISFEEVITIKEKTKKKKKKKSKKKKKNKSDEESEDIENIEAPEVETEEVESEDDVEATNEEVTPKEDDVIIKQKITKTYFVKLRSILKFEDGTTEDKTWTYPVKEVQEREDESAGKHEERYQLVIKTKGKKEVYLYLNGDRTVSSFEAEGTIYLMRGH